MSIKKALMHYFDKATNGMIAFHPETESACVTDWHTGIMNSLASTTLGTVVSALTTDSVFGKLMSLLLSASGVKYSLGPNGYVKFGSFFGGLIIQWVLMSVTQTGGQPISWPLTATLLRGYGCDGGNWYNSVGIDSTDNKVYVPKSTGASLFGIFK